MKNRTTLHRYVVGTRPRLRTARARLAHDQFPCAILALLEDVDRYELWPGGAAAGGRLLVGAADNLPTRNYCGETASQQPHAVDEAANPHRWRRLKDVAERLKHVLAACDECVARMGTKDFLHDRAAVLVAASPDCLHRLDALAAEGGVELIVRRQDCHLLVRSEGFQGVTELRCLSVALVLDSLGQLPLHRLKLVKLSTHFAHRRKGSRPHSRRERQRWRCPSQQRKHAEKRRSSA
mmetsp:Transcript_25149/g.81141  ORF Transcript_25149/g.81141 Transcript_25149/m.81141 type:complete len:237 (+) Transcript_25149:35-745(+)